MINIADYDYFLPDDRIAQYPCEKRDESKLLLYNRGDISKDSFRNIVDYIPSKSLLVFNNTRVIKARLLFHKKSGAAIEIFCLRPLNPADYDRAFASTESVEWECIVGNLKKWKSERLELPIDNKGTTLILYAEKGEKTGDSITIRFSWTPSEKSFAEVLELLGHTPLPPYIKRSDETIDDERYQTVYSKIDGSVAAPTAGLHFTPNLIEELHDKNIGIAEVTLHVGAGTFKPVKDNDVSKHCMHNEFYTVTAETLRMLRENAGNIIAVGTTSVRTLESIYHLGVKIKRDFQCNLITEQWEPYNWSSDMTFVDAIDVLLNYIEDNSLNSIEASTELIIVKGYKYKTIKGLITNFHQPKSTLLLLLAAFVGDNWKEAYRYALENDFRFLSYGDSSFWIV